MATRALHSDPTLGERSWLTTSNCPIFRSTAVIPSEAAQSPWQSKVGVLDPGCFCPRQGLSSEQYLLGSREREPLLTGEQYLLGSREREPGVGKGGPVGLGKTFSESYRSLRLFLRNSSLSPSPGVRAASPLKVCPISFCSHLTFTLQRHFPQ